MLLDYIHCYQFHYLICEIIRNKKATPRLSLRSSLFLCGHNTLAYYVIAGPMILPLHTLRNWMLDIFICILLLLTFY
jgi:hypothetical protein